MRYYPIYERFQNHVLREEIMSKVKVNGVNLYYETHGQGQPLVCISGFGADHTLWQGIFDHLLDTYKVILFDNRGAGQSDVPDSPWLVDQMAQDTASLCKELDIKRAHFIGSSMGGHILQTLAKQHSNLVNTAVICNSTMKTNPCFHLYLQAQLELLQAGAPLSALTKSAISWAYSGSYLTKPGIVDELLSTKLESAWPFTVRGYEAQFAALGAFDSTSWAHQIKTPTLVIGADEDAIFSSDSIKALADNIEGAQYYQFNACGHLPMVEQPELFTEVVTSFLSTYPIR